MFLLFNSEEEAVARNVQAAKDAGFSYYADIPEEEKDVHTIYVWGMTHEEGENPRYALDIEGGQDLLTEEEVSSLGDLPEDWSYEILD
jgi:hypothetical protein